MEGKKRSRPIKCHNVGIHGCNTMGMYMSLCAYKACSQIRACFHICISIMGQLKIQGMEGEGEGDMYRWGREGRHWQGTCPVPVPVP